MCSNVTVLFLKDEITDDKIRSVKERFMSAYDTTADGRLQIQEVCLLVFIHTYLLPLLFVYRSCIIKYTYNPARGGGGVIGLIKMS